MEVIIEWGGKVVTYFMSMLLDFFKDEIIVFIIVILIFVASKVGFIKLMLWLVKKSFDEMTKTMK